MHQETINTVDKQWLAQESIKLNKQSKGKMNETNVEPFAENSLSLSTKNHNLPTFSLPS